MKQDIMSYLSTNMSKCENINCLNFLTLSCIGLANSLIKTVRKQFAVVCGYDEDIREYSFKL